MKLQRREKILAAAAVGLVLLSAAWFLLFSGGSLSYRQLEVRCDQLETQVRKKEADVKAAKVAEKRLADWQRRALPSDTTDAPVLYQTWLRQLTDRLQFQQPTIQSTPVQSKPKTFTLWTFKVRGRTSLSKLVEFLYEFYSAGHLHQIRLIDVKTIPNSTDLDVNIDVEAMSLPGADRKGELTKERSKSFGLAKLSDYSKRIEQRNLFGPFRPAGAPPDAAQTTFVTGIVAVEGRGEVWLVDRTTGKDWKLHEGETLQVGLFQGRVKAISMDEITIDVGGRLRRYHKGDNLRGGEEVGGPQQPGPPRMRHNGPPPHAK